MHFVIQAPNLAQMYINMLRTFSDIGHLKFSFYVRHIGFQNGRHLKSTFDIISGHNAAIDLILVSKCILLGARNPMVPNNNELESVQLRKHCISKAERHLARRSGFFGFVWFENIVFERFASSAWQPPRGDMPTIRTSQRAHALNK